MLRRLALVAVVLFICTFDGFARPARQKPLMVYPSPLTEPFDVWLNFTHGEKTVFYSGWANGFFMNSKDAGTLALGGCLQKLTFEQIVAMVDKWSTDHHEKFHDPVGTEIIEAVTSPESPCAGIHPDRQ